MLVLERIGMSLFAIYSALMLFSFFISVIHQNTMNFLKLMKDNIFKIILIGIIPFCNYYLILTFPNYTQLNTLKSILGLISVAAVGLIIHKMTIKKSILYSIVFILLVAVSSASTALVYSIFKINLIKSKVVIVLDLLGNCIQKGFLVIFIEIIGNFKILGNFKIRINNQSAINVLLLPISLCLIWYVNYSFYAAHILIFTNNRYLIISLILAITLIGIGIFYAKKILELENIINELNHKKLYNNNMESVVTEMRRVKHNYNNIVGTIGGYVQTEEWDRLKGYINELSDGSERINSLESLKKLDVKNLELFSLISRKIKNAYEKGINFRIEKIDTIRDIDILSEEFIKALSCLIDKAISETEYSENKKIALKILDKSDALIFEIQNSIIKLEKIKLIIPNKDINILSEILNKSDNITLDTFTQDTILIQNLILKKI